MFWLAAGPQPEQPPAPSQPRYSQVIVRRQIIIRSMRVGPGTPQIVQSIEWKESKGPKCVPVKIGRAHV